MIEKALFIQLSESAYILESVMLIFHVVFCTYIYTNGLLTVIDATNIQDNARKRILETAKQQNVLPIAIVLNLPQETLKATIELALDQKEQTIFHK